VHAYGGWAGDAETTGRVSSSRIDAELREDTVDEADDRTEESPIIDVPAEPQPPEPTWAPPPAEEAFDGGVHRLAFEEPPAQEDRPGRRRRAEEPQPEPAHQQGGPEQQGAGWQPAPAEGEWIPAGVPGSNWVSPPVEAPVPPEYVGRRRAPDAADHDATSEEDTEPPRGRHSVDATEVTDPHLPVVPAEEESAPVMGPAEETAEEARARRQHSAEDTGGPSVADLLARFQSTPSSGGGRRRRAE
jgi:hypothetical protein